MLVIDTATNKVTQTWPTAPATAPHGTAVDAEAGALLIAGGNGKLIMMSQQDGHSHRLRGHPRAGGPGRLRSRPAPGLLRERHRQARRPERGQGPTVTPLGEVACPPARTASPSTPPRTKSGSPTPRARKASSSPSPRRLEAQPVIGSAGFQPAGRGILPRPRAELSSRAFDRRLREQELASVQTPLGCPRVRSAASS